MGTHTLALGKSSSREQVKATLQTNSDVKEAIPKLAVSLASDSKKPTGKFAAAAKRLDSERYRKGLTLPNA
ncbi:MAG TPA: hypothetical protein DDW68_07330 [Verrucomicrobiales bacterium]|nr:hypothetical protein [Verrucomicrobiales bacterium]HBE96969.1 hypothetical protein [Verrucomicrobiales bacterium]|tara:strand:+ start:1135 stop:1347 length:213 start_codon:yes stop_codon:yes gene_type:complete